MARENRIHTNDLIKMGVSVVFGMSTVEFLKVSGLINDLAENLGGSTPAAYMALMVISGIVLVTAW